MHKNNRKRILFIGDLTPFSRSSQRYETLRRIGHGVVGLSWSTSRSSTILEKVYWKLGFPKDVALVNKKITMEIGKTPFDIVWVEKGNTVWPETLKFIKDNFHTVKLISLSEDDMYAKHNRSRYYRRGLKYFDVVFTTKTYNLEELKRFGVGRTELFLDAYDETLHRPVKLSHEEKVRYGCDVGFVGTFEKDRAKNMLFLAQSGIRVVVWGNGWGKWKTKHQNLVVKDRAIYGEEYVKAINATKVNLCFLRKINRDEVTSRSVEIPACGGFMLGERTARHLVFFNEGKEAEFFSSQEELLSKTEQYLKDDTRRKQIGMAGRNRCVQSGYSHTAQLDNVISKVELL